MRIIRHGDRKIALHPVERSSDTRFEVNNFEPCINSLADCEPFFTGEKKKFLKEAVLQEVVMSGGSSKKDGQDTLYTNDIAWLPHIMLRFKERNLLCSVQSKELHYH